MQMADGNADYQKSGRLVFVSALEYMAYPARRMAKQGLALAVAFGRGGASGAFNRQEMAKSRMVKSTIKFLKS
jgi:hypothetical protein